MSTNQVVLAGEILLNGRVNVLIRFCLGRYACVADNSDNFFQERVPCNQQDWFRIVWYSNNDLDNEKPKMFQFTRHIWVSIPVPMLQCLLLSDWKSIRGESH